MFDPVDYEENKEKAQNRINSVFVPKLTRLVNTNFTEGNILDYGCGPGSTGFQYFLPLAEQSDSQLYSVDVSIKMVEFAEKHFSNPRIHYEQGYLPHKFPFPDIKFDTVFSINVFHFVKDIEVTLNSIYSLLKPGGRLAFTTTTIKNGGISILRHLLDSPIWGKYMVGCEQHVSEWSDYKSEQPDVFFKKIFIENTGFKEIHFEYSCQNITMDMELGLNSAFSLNPCLPNVPMNLRDELREEYRRYLTKQFNNPLDSSSLNATFDFICAVLEKPSN